VKRSNTRLAFLIANTTLFLVVSALVIAPAWRRGANRLRNLTNLLPATAKAAQLNPWSLAVQKIKEDRGEPTGRAASVEIPTELRHYSNTRRFLATQVAHVKERQIGTPADLVDLAAMIGRGELVQLAPVSENYILFGVGGKADKQPFTRYEKGKSINLYSEAGLREEYRRLAESQTGLLNEIAGLKQQLAQLKRRERAQRVNLQTQLTAGENKLKLERSDKALLDFYYGNAEKRQQLFADYVSLEKLGRQLSATASDLSDGSTRQQFKVQILSSLRPEALKVLDEVAVSYRQKFSRPLPITSLVRPDEYQFELSKTNPNATRIETPPHSTGLAFDIFYGYMTAAEQSHVMSDLARLEDEGRIEVLRENRNHYHVFAFVDGARPHEEFITAAMGARPAKLASARVEKSPKQAHHTQKKKAVTKKAVTKSRVQRVRSKTRR
jgi:hypothetical protein